MIQVKLIESEEYYGHRRRFNLYHLLLLVFPTAIIFNARHFPWTVVTVNAILFVVLVILMVRNVRRFNALTGKRVLHVGEDRIWVNGPNAASHLDIPLKDVNQIILPGHLEIPLENMKGIAGELKGKGTQNYIILEIGDRQHRFDFVVDSYYLIKKLDDIVQSWINQGIKVQRV